MNWKTYLTDDERDTLEKATIARDVNRAEYSKLWHRLKNRADGRKRTEVKRDARS